MSKASELSEDRCRALVDYLRSSKQGHGQYPSEFSVNDKRGLRQQATFFEEKDGVLYHKKVDHTANLVTLQRVIISKKERTQVIQACHDGIDGSHFGRDKTLSKVRF
jgi:hypothetical protein